MKRVVLPPLVPPLKTSSWLLTWTGLDSANSTSAVVVPVPISAEPHAFLAAVVSVAWILPALQVGTPLVLIVPFLSVSRTNSLSAGGWDPSTVAILPEAFSLIGASLFFGSAVGVKPPLKVR